MYVYCNFHPCCSLNIPSVFQVLNSSCPIDTDLAQASPGVWAGGYVSAIALWLQPCGQSIWAWPPLADCVDNSTGVEKEWLQGHLLGGGIGVGEGARTNHIGSGAPVENGGIQRRTCQRLL